MSEPNTPQDPLSAPHWNPAEPGADAPGLASDATQLWDPTEVPTSVGTAAGVDATATAGSAAGAAASDMAAPGASTPWSPVAPLEQPVMPAGAIPPLGAEGVARGVASGRPRMVDDPPTGRKTPPAAIVGSVIGLAIVVALGAWFLLVRPAPNTALANPSPSPIVIVTPSPGATSTAEPTAEATPLATPIPAAFKAPTFTGKTLAEAQALADSGGLKLDIQYDRTTNQPNGTVLSQAPPPGSSVLPGDQIFLIVAKPGPTVLVPDAQGVAEADAVNLLLDSDLEPGTRTQAFDADVAAGAIVSTDPAAGKEVARGSSVDYVVSSGPEPAATPTPSPTPDMVPVPDVTGIDEADAFNQLLDSDLTPGERTEAYDPDIATGLVISTDPCGEHRGRAVARRSTTSSRSASNRHRPPSRHPSRPPNRPPSRPPSPRRRPCPYPTCAASPRPMPSTRCSTPTCSRAPAPRHSTPTSPPAWSSAPIPRRRPRSSEARTVDYIVSLGVEPTPTPEPTPEPTLPNRPPNRPPSPPRRPCSCPTCRCRRGGRRQQLLDADLQPGARSDAYRPRYRSRCGRQHHPRGHDRGGARLARSTTSCRWASNRHRPPSRHPEAAPCHRPPSRPPSPRRRPCPYRTCVASPRPMPSTRSSTRACSRAPAPRHSTPTSPPAWSVGTTPAATTEVDRGSTVDYIVSLGVEPTPTPEPTPEPTLPPTPEPTPQPTPATVSVPDVRGFAEADAVNTLLDQDLQPGTRTEAFDPDIAAGLVSGTTPAATTEVDRGSTVDYVVSLGVEPTRPRADTRADPATDPRADPQPTPATVSVPDVRGFAEADAVNTLLDQGLQPGTRTEAYDPDIAAGLVSGTDPPRTPRWTVARRSTTSCRWASNRHRPPSRHRADTRTDPRADPPAHAGTGRDPRPPELHA